MREDRILNLDAEERHLVKVLEVVQEERGAEVERDAKDRAGGVVGDAGVSGNVEETL